MTLVFSAALLIPCFCATAMAAEAQTEDSTDCCPETGESNAESSPDDQQSDHEDTSCCCDGPVSCSSNDAADAQFLPNTVTSSFDEDLDAPNQWWTPDMVATLWLVDQLSEGVEVSETQPVSLHTVRPDRSDAYLEHSVLIL